MDKKIIENIEKKMEKRSMKPIFKCRQSFGQMLRINSE